ncbi:MAG: Ubiquinone biosynthesis O-methyltransferase [Syntrophorhabdus sp. PtaB.Bin027]|nr:MAG: Ubiquinone biosynthesis O-methyltransferase [Syntrophorhabdus sp. PtaB.Bin027]
MAIQDLAKKEYWDDYYSDCNQMVQKNWTPIGYNSQVIEHILIKEIHRCNPKTILEIGCGNSTWLSYLAKKTNAQVTGIDYSEEGCYLALQRLKEEGVVGQIVCKDIFQVDHETIGQYDFVYSLGVVEHFSDLTGILKEELRFVKPGGVLFTSIPNLKYSIHGLLSWIYHPEILKKHKKISKTELIMAYKSCGLQNIEGNYAGLFSLGIVAWGKYPKWKRISKFILPFLLIIVSCVDYPLSKMKCYGGIPPTSPFIYVKGEKKKNL